MSWLIKRLTRAGMAGAMVFASLLVPSTSAALADELVDEPSDESSGPEGCNYGTDGEYAESLCWIDMAEFDAASASTESGQKMTIELGNDIIVEFVAKVTSENEGGVNATAIPTYGTPPGNRAVLGNDLYRDTDGKPALVADHLKGDQATISLNSVKVTQNGDESDRYSLVVADAESTDGTVKTEGQDYYEALNLGSDKPLNQLYSQQPEGFSDACARKYDGNGTTSVVCEGASPDANTRQAGALAWYANSPTSISAKLRGDGPAGSQQAVAFGVMFANVEVVKDLQDPGSIKGNGRYDSTDQFKVAAEGLTEAETVEENTTSTTGKYPLLIDPNGQEVVFSETALNGANFEHYDTSVECFNNDEPLSGDRVSVEDGQRKATVTVQPLESVRCEFTNTPKLGEASWQKISDDDEPALLPDSEWTLTGPGEEVTVVADNGENDQDSAIGRIRVNGLKWGDYTLKESKAPVGFQASNEEEKFTISKDSLSPLEGVKIENKRLEPALKLEKLINDDPDSEAAPGIAVKPKDEMKVTYTVTNTGKAVLKNVSVSDTIVSPRESSVPADSIKCEKTDLQPSESTECTATVAAPSNNGESHQNTALAHGTPEGSTTPIDSNEDSAFAHTPEVGGFTIAKGLEADTPNLTESWEDKTFIFEYECQDTNGQELKKGTVELKPGEDKDVVDSIGGIEEGASCTVTETDASVDNFEWTPEWDITGGQFTKYSENSVTFTIASGDPGQPVALGVKNNYKAETGIFNIVKTIDGEAAAAAANKDFEFNYSCTVGGKTVKSGEVTIVGAGTAKIEGVPLNSACTITETGATVPGTAVESTITPAEGRSDVDNSFSLVNDEDRMINVDVKNTYTYVDGGFTITKQIGGNAVSFAPDEFTVNYKCEAPANRA